MPGSDHEPGPDHGSMVAFTGATVWTGTGDAAISRATLLVEDGRVVSVSIDAPPPEAEVVDLTGSWIMPGFIDTHAHVTGRWAPEAIQDPAGRVAADLALFARYGVTTVNSLGGEPPEAAAVRDGQGVPSLTRARLQFAGPVIVDRDPASARATAEANVALGVNWLKLRVDDNLGTAEKLPWEAVQSVMDVGAENGIPVATHIFYEADAARVLEMGSGLIAHSVRDQDVSDSFVAQLVDSGVCYVPTLTREVSTFVYAERPEFFDDPFFQYGADPAEVARVSEPEFMTAMRESPTAEGYRRALAQAQENLGVLAAAGVPIAFGTDAGPAARFPGYFEHLEFDLMVEAGLEPEAILVSATSGAAACLGLEDVGALSEGRWADFLVFGADPLADVAATRTLARVYIAGNEIPR
jgi:imidazolonepropionase-like amidohydrolase